MTTPEKINDPSRESRFNSHVARSAAAFTKFGQDAELMLAVTFYIATRYQGDNLFSLDTFSVNDFATSMNMKAENLYRKHTDPKYLRDHPKGSNQFYQTRIGNALYRLHNEALNMITEHKNYAGKESFKSKSLLILEDLNVEYVTEGNRKRARISYVPDRNFILGINKAFTLTERRSFIQLNGKKNLSRAYVYIAKLRDWALFNQNGVAKVDFDELADCMGLVISQPKNIKVKIRNKLRSLREQSELSFDFKFFQSSGQWSYGIVLHFHPEKDYPEKRKKAWMNAVKDTYTLFVREDYFAKYGHLEGFEDWNRNNDRDLNHKANRFLEAYNFLINDDRKKISWGSKKLLRFFKVDSLEAFSGGK